MEHTPSSTPEPNRSGCWRIAGTIALVLLGAALFTAALTFYGFYRQGEAFVQKVETLFAQPTPTPQIDVRAVIVKQVRNASELTTAIYSMETIVAQSQARELLGVQVGETKMIYVAYGEVRAGVDLSEIDVNDVRVISDTVIIRLPPPKLLDAKIDVERSYVYDFDKSLFGPVDPAMQSRAEQLALAKIRRAACENAILEEANNRAAIAVRALLEAASFRNVEVVTTPPAPSTCPKDEEGVSSP